MYVSYDRAKTKNWQFLVLTWLSFAGLVKIARGHDRGYSRMLALSLYNRLAMDICTYVTLSHLTSKSQTVVAT